jgi:hypothetical protein
MLDTPSVVAQINLCIFSRDSNNLISSEVLNGSHEHLEFVIFGGMHHKYGFFSSRRYFIFNNKKKTDACSLLAADGTTIKCVRIILASSFAQVCAGPLDTAHQDKEGKDLDALRAFIKQAALTSILLLLERFQTDEKEKWNDFYANYMKALPKRPLAMREPAVAAAESKAGHHALLCHGRQNSHRFKACREFRGLSEGSVGRTIPSSLTVQLTTLHKAIQNAGSNALILPAPSFILQENRKSLNSRIAKELRFLSLTKSVQQVQAVMSEAAAEEAWVERSLAKDPLIEQTPENHRAKVPKVPTTGATEYR